MMQMLRHTLLAVFIGFASANICNQDSGFWLNSHAEGVTDFAYGGVPLNSRYNCFQGSLATQVVDQAFKVAFNGSAPSTPSLEAQKPGKRTSQVFLLKKVIENHDDFNEMNCVDPALRAGVADAINKATDHSCQAIVKAILFNINLPQWAVNCIDFNKSRSSDVISVTKNYFYTAGVDSMKDRFQDYNFCQYQANLGEGMYVVIRMAKIDMS
ncbi:unnamed protein product [Haemonchus placei]|uniref:Ground-like domain-containing protein n=1 Tax=Haemonchus placei TaxID=6290 RepID=A0A0N4WR94_HAEPC|nr:unnamed protein product [Haemonchus placei]